MDNHYSMPRRSLGASGADHLLLGIGAAVTLDYQEHRLKVSQDSGRAPDMERARCVHEDHDAPQNATLAIPRDPRRIGHRIDCKGAAIRQIPSPATTIDTELDRSPLSPIGPEERCLFDRIPLTRSPEMMEVTPDPVATIRATIPVITIGLPSPSTSDTKLRSSRCCPSHLSDNGSSPRLQGAYPMLQTGVGLKQLCDVSPQDRGHAVPIFSDSGPCKCCSGGRYETPISPVESVGASSAHFEPVSFWPAVRGPLLENDAVGHCQTSSSCSVDSAYGSATSTTLRQSSNSRSRFLRVPSPLRDNQSNHLPTTPPSSLSTRSTSGDSRDAPQPRTSGPSNVFVCRLQGCFDRNRCFFLDMESRNEHERDKHSLDYPKAIQKAAQMPRIEEASQQTGSSSRDSTASNRPPQVVEEPHLTGTETDAESDPRVLVARYSQDSNLLNKTPSNTENSPKASKTYQQERPEVGKDTTMSPASSVTSQATPSTSSTLSSEMELLKPMPKSKIDEMIDNVMEECEGMFDYVLGFNIHDDMSDAADSEYEESDADDDDDVVSPASPMFQRPGESSSPTSSSSSPQSAILGSPAKCHTVAGESNRAGGTPKAATNARAGRPSNSSNAQRKRKAQGSDQQEENDDDGDGNSERKKQKKDSEEETKGLRFACPYWQKHGRTGQGRTKMHASCVFPGFSTVARLKEHLYRCHLQPAYCVRCCQLFPSQQELNSHHLAPERCPDVPNKPVIDGITDDQAKQLRSRRVKEGVKTEEAKWTNVYFILFPNDREAPSPYCVNNQDTASLSPESIMFQDFEDYSRREFPALFRAELKRDAEEEEALMQERFRRKMVDAARRATERLYTEYRRNRLQVDTNNSGGAGPSQQVRASVSGQMEFLDAPPPQSDAIQDVRTTVPRGGGSRGPSAQADASSDSAYETLLSESNHAYLTTRLPSTAAPGDLTQDQSRFDDPGLHLNAMIGGQPLSEGSNNPIDGPRIMQIQQQPEWFGLNFDFLKDQNMYTDAYSEDPSLQAPFSGNSPMGGDPTNRNG